MSLKCGFESLPKRNCLVSRFHSLNAAALITHVLLTGEVENELEIHQRVTGAWQGV